MNKTIFLNAGHHTEDPGAIFGEYIERDLTIILRDGLVPLLKEQGFKVEKCPDNLNLKDSIEWNRKNSSNINDGLALSIHFNAGGGKGAETFYYGGNKFSKNIAKNLLDEYCKTTKLKSRGAKPDTQALHGSLGWIRKTKTWAVLIEVAFIDNIDDMKYVVDHIPEVLEGLCKGVCKAFSVIYQVPQENDLKKQIKKKMKELDNLINLL